MAKRLDLTGSTFGRLYVITRGIKRGAKTVWVCQCTCGKRREIATYLLTSGQTRSCGCLKSETTTAKNLTHGQSVRGATSGTYTTWANMMQRCMNPNNDNFINYGGRGITVCGRWLDFSNFFSDMGKRPARKSLERVNNSGNYEPSNCKWATFSEQARNKRNNRILNFKGRSMMLSEWSEHLGIRLGTLSHRLYHYHWSIERVLGTPV
jgi:hypothetical protein